MLRTFEAVVEDDGRLRLLEPQRLPVQARALVTLLDDEGADLAHASEAALSDWNDPAEDAAWADLQPGR